MIGLGTIVNTAAVIVGSALIFCVGVNLVREKTFKVANMLPALLIPILWEIWRWCF